MVSNRVTELMLLQQNLGGSITPKLGNLSSLRRLNLNGNQLSGDDPLVS